MRKHKRSEKPKNFTEQQWKNQVETKQTAQYITKMKSDIAYLKGILFRWSIANNRNSYYDHKEKELIKKYIQCHHDYYEYDQFDSNFHILENLNINLDRINSEELILKSFNLFKKARWEVRFHSKFVSRICDYNLQELYYVLGFIHYFANGEFQTKKNLNFKYGYVRQIEAKSIPFNRFFVGKIFRQKNIFIHIGVQKIPIVAKNNLIKRYEFKSYMHFLDILGDQFVENKNKLEERMNYFTDNIFSDVAKRDHSDEIEIEWNKTVKTQSYFFWGNINPYIEQMQYYAVTFNNNEEKNSIYHPLIFKPYYVSANQNTTMIYDSEAKRWMSKDHLSSLEKKKMVEYQRQINEEMIKRFVDFQSAKTLVELLTKIPNFNVNLTEQEKDVIGENGNVLAIGRSGTGKTTCAVLRLFSIEMLFKIRLSLYKKKFQSTIKDTRCSSDDIDQTFGLHCIFLTASPVLTHEIQRYYKKLTDNIKDELEKKKKKAQQQKIEKENIQKEKKQIQTLKNQKAQEQIIQKQEIIAIPDECVRTDSQKSVELIEQQNEINEQLKDIKLKQSIKNELFDQDEQDFDEMKNKFEENIKKFHSLFDLEDNDYPGFFTVKSYIMMVDGVLSKPFFIRKKNVLIDQESKAAWHNERKGVMMIQNYFRAQSNQQNNEIEQIEQEINYSDEEELQNEYLRQIQLKQNRGKQQLTKKLQAKKGKSNLSFEVDYDYFVVHFWPQVKRRFYSSRNITPHLVWTQIFSTIKGSASAHQYPFQYLTQAAYKTLSSNTFLTDAQKLDIYQLFCQYERWKIRAGGYDLMDTVNYILNQIRFKKYQGPEIHYLMIDEVQDLPHAVIYLLSKTASYGVFYSGDTAQTIAKGVGFRFCDLKSLFNQKLYESGINLKAPITKHLTVNFRSHNNILQMANSIVSSIEILFPKTIDRMKKQISDLSGPKPMILSQNDEELLFYVLCGGDSMSKIQDKDNQLKKPPLQFGCDQVIIVRDQQSKSKIPSMLQHALCLTIYEAKGLEFNDVILFNFFAESNCPEKWNLLKYLSIISTLIPKEQYQNNLSRHLAVQKKEEEEYSQVEKETKKQQNQTGKQEQKIQEVDVDCSYNKEKNSYIVKKIVGNLAGIFKDINDYAELCSQLKLLYTAVTRPRKTLIIYDNNSAARKNIERIWQKLDIVQLITKEMILEASRIQKQKSIQFKVFDKIVTATNQSEWKKQGMKMYTRGYFEQAMKCFERSGNVQLYKKAQANRLADEATKKLIQIESQRNAIKQGFHLYQGMSNSQISKLKRQFKHIEHTSFAQFKKAAEIFESLLLFKQAGQCYFSGKFYEKAFESFCKAFMHKQAAQSLEMENKYREAAEYYEKADEYLKVIECLDLVNEWSIILQKIQKYELKMSEIQKQSLLKKYSALALQQLVYEIQFQNEIEEKKPQNNKVEIIQERESDEQQQYDSDEDPELAAERQYQRKASQQLSSNNPSRKPSEVQEEKLVEIQQSVFEKLIDAPSSNIIEKKILQNKQVQQNKQVSFSDLNQSSQTAILKEQSQVQKQKVMMKSIDVSFGDLNQSSFSALNDKSIVQKNDQNGQIQSLESFSDLNTKFQNQLQPDLQSIKSLVDPDDLWVKNSISQIGHKMQSEYSVIDEEENYNINAKIIKTKGNIFVQDQIMRRIIKIVSIINTSVQEFFKQFKGYQSLITVSKSQNQNQSQIANRPQISEFEDIDPQFINIILDTLQSFKLFKLCLFVCNRYHLPSRAGRYLVSLGLKYSTNCQSSNIINPILLAPSTYRKNEIEKGILASIALHAIFQNVNADFLKIRIQDNDYSSKNSLGLYFIQGLILQGVYKKTIFMLNPQESLKILTNYNDLDGFNNIFKQKILKQLNKEQEKISFLPYKPQNSLETEYVKINLKRVMFEYCVAEKFQTVSQRFYKQFGQESIVKSSKNQTQPQIKTISLPHYLKFAKALIQKREQIVYFLRQNIETCYSILTKGTELQILDLLFIILAILHSEELQRQLIQIFGNNDFLELFRCLSVIRLSLRKLPTSKSIWIVDSVFSMHQCYRIKSCKSMKSLGDGFSFVHRTSVLANEFVENNKSNSHHFAYFFEQDSNLILVKTSKLIKIVIKKYQNALIKLYQKKLNYQKNQKGYLREKYNLIQEEKCIKKALQIEIENIGGIKPKQKIDKKQKKKLKPSFDFKIHSKEQYAIVIGSSSQSQAEQQIITYTDDIVMPNFNPKMKYISELILSSFLKHSTYSKDIVIGKDLYACNSNHYYREYTQKFGGYNLFDSIQFKRFKRLDLYASNILSVYDDLPFLSKHTFLSQILILLLVELKSKEQMPQKLVQLTSDNLKYLQGLQIISANLKGQIAQIEAFTNEQIEYLIENQYQCIFEYKNEYVSEMSKEDLVNMTCEYLQFLREQHSSNFLHRSNIILSYLINLKPIKKIYETIRRIMPMLQQQFLPQLRDTKNLEDFKEKRNQLFNSTYIKHTFVLHQINTTSIGNLTIAIEKSQFDYEVEGRIINARRKAATKIWKWWKLKRNEMKQKKLSGNYLVLASEKSQQQAKKQNSIVDIRLARVLRKKKVEIDKVDIDILLLSQKAKEQLLTFYLTNIISSSLDFHFILISLNKIQQNRQNYFKISEQSQNELQEEELETVRQNIIQIISQIDIWKNDTKWLRDRNINFKKKKVFEVKWMTKNLGLQKIIKKRAGLKKQEKLQQKKRNLKRIQS